MSYLKHRSSILLLSCVLLASCGSRSFDPTPDPTAGFKDTSPALEQVARVAGQESTNVVIEDTEGLGLKLTERTEREVPEVVRSVAQNLEPALRITAPVWGDVLQTPLQVEGTIEGDEDLEALFLLNGQLVHRGDFPFRLTSVPQGAEHYLLQGFLIERSGRVRSSWMTGLRGSQGRILPFTLEDPVLSVLSPLPSQNYDRTVPLQIDLKGIDIAPGVAGLEYTIDGVTQVSYFLQPIELTLAPGVHRLSVRVVNPRGEGLLAPLFFPERAFTVQ